MNSNIVFKEYGIIDVTRFDATPENPEVGYVCGGFVTVLSDGRILIHDANEGRKLLEDFRVSDLIRVNTHVNDDDSEYEKETALLKMDKSIRITFTEIEEKERFIEALENLIM